MDSYRQRVYHHIHRHNHQNNFHQNNMTNELRQLTLFCPRFANQQAFESSQHLTFL